ncbi:MAG TPA: holin [Allocoleopsis sp.]
MSGINPRDTKRVVYIGLPEQLQGIRASADQFIFYETWRNHPKADLIDDYVRAVIAKSHFVKKVKRVDGMFTKTFWKRTLDRVVSTGAQYALGTLGTVAVLSVAIDWRALLIGTGFAALLSLLKALAGSKIGNNSADPGWTSTTSEDKDVDEAATKPANANS